MNSLSAGAHDHNHPLGIGGADVLIRLVLAADNLGEIVHCLLYMPGAGFVIRVDRLTCLEEDVGVLSCASDDRPVRCQGPFAVGVNLFLVHQFPQLIIGDLFHLGDLVGGAEPVEEVNEGNSRGQCRHLGDAGHVVGFLDRVRRQHAPPGLAAGIDIRVVTEDRQGVGCNGPSRYVEDRRCQFAGDLVHVWDHQEQALRGGEGGCQSPGLQGAVHCARGAALGL